MFHFSVFQPVYEYRKQEHDEGALFPGIKQTKSEQTKSGQPKYVITRPLTQPPDVKQTAKYR